MAKIQQASRKSTCIVWMDIMAGFQNVPNFQWQFSITRIIRIFQKYWKYKIRRTIFTVNQTFFNFILWYWYWHFLIQFMLTRNYVYSQNTVFSWSTFNFRLCQRMYLILILQSRNSKTWLTLVVINICKIWLNMH